MSVVVCSLVLLANALAGIVYLVSRVHPDSRSTFAQTMTEEWMRRRNYGRRAA